MEIEEGDHVLWTNVWWTFGDEFRWDQIQPKGVVGRGCPGVGVAKVKQVIIQRARAADDF